MSAVEVISLILISLGTVLCIVCVATPYWKVNDPEDTTRDTVFRHQGLWLECTSFSVGNWDCDDFNRFFLGLPMMFQTVRALTIIAVVFSTFGMVILSFGLESCTCGPENLKTKSRIRLFGAILGALAGLLLLVSVSWYANDVRLLHIRETQILLTNPTYTANRFIFGVSLFLGWGGGVLLILGALFVFCTSCFNGDSYEEERPHYTYRPPTKMANPGQEYI